jgi:hypothetical protein
MIRNFEVSMEGPDAGVAGFGLTVVGKGAYLKDIEFATRASM